MSITRLIPLLLSGLFLIAHFGSSAQTQLVTTPNASPKAKVIQEIGLTYVKVVFYRPAVNNRNVWTDLAPEGAVWRAGANDNTIISFSEDVKVEGEPLAAGQYGLHIIPKGERATLIFSEATSAWGSFSYNPKEDALRVEVSVQEMDHHMERLNYVFSDLSSEAGTCALVWAKKAFPFRIETATDEIVVASLREELRNKAGWTWRGWHEAAQWCLQQEANLQEGFQWASRSVFMDANPQNLIVKARLNGLIKGEGDADLIKEAAFASLETDLGQYAVGWQEYNAAANYALNQGQLEKAMSWSEKSIEDRENMQALLVHSQVLTKAGKGAEAKNMKAKALDIGTNGELNAYGYQLLFAGKGEEAISVFLKNTEKNPEDPNVWDSLGEGYFTLGKYEEATQALKKSLTMDPPANVKANSLKLLSQMGVKMEGPETNQ